MKRKEIEIMHTIAISQQDSVSLHELERGPRSVMCSMRIIPGGSYG